jgi:arylsulfatase A-like enzyme
LKARGYATAIVGKWHLGQLPQFLPMRQGFDYWFGLPYSHDMRMTAPRENGYQSAAYYDPKPQYWDVPLMRNGDVIERPVDHRTLTRRYTDEAVRFINEHRARPFLLYLAHSLPHIPLARSADFEGHSRAGIYGDVIEEIDASTGRILDALDIRRRRSAHAGRVQQRQRSVAAVRRARRLRGAAPRRQGDDVGRRRAGRRRYSGGPARFGRRW